MPVYHFHAKDGRAAGRARIELADDAAAKAEAVRWMAHLVGEETDLVWDTGAFQVEVTDGRGLSLFCIDVVVTVAAALRTAAKPRDHRP